MGKGKVKTIKPTLDVFQIQQIFFISSFYINTIKNGR